MRYHLPSMRVSCLLLALKLTVTKSDEKGRLKLRTPRLSEEATVLVVILEYYWGSVWNFCVDPHTKDVKNKAMTAVNRRLERNEADHILEEESEMQTQIWYVDERLLFIAS